MTAVLAKPGGTMSLRPIQAEALYEIGEYRRFLGSMRVGSGKTIVSLLAPYVLDAKRPILLLPAALREKTEHERRVLAKHWRIPSNIRILSYEELGREKAADMLSFYRPDVIIGDEAHKLKNRKTAGVTRRVGRYWQENEVTIILMSGTLITSSILDFGHLAHWSFGDESPCPTTVGELEEWANVLDENPNPFNRLQPGALLDWAKPEDRDDDKYVTARRGFRRRLLETPGMVSTGQDQVSCSLYVRALEYTPKATTEENFKTLRTKWETPDGWPLTQAVDVWRHAKELALGLHYVWDPRPPEDWREARRAWASFVRETLSRSRTLDTEAQVASACIAGELSDLEYRAWTDIRDTFRPNTKPLWHDDTALDVCTAWLKKGPGIVWVKHGFFGEELERRTGAPYFRQGGENSRGENLQVLADLVRDGKRKPFGLIASQDACSAGFNLQPWFRNLLTSCPSSSKDLEQIIGRTHRDMQKADAVEVDVLVGCIEHVEAWERARGRARMTEDLLGAPQKIVFADSVFPSLEEVSQRRGSRWEKTTGKSDDEDGEENDE